MPKAGGRDSRSETGFDGGSMSESDLSMCEVAAVIGCSETTVARMVQDEQIKSYRVRGLIRITREEVDRIRRGKNDSGNLEAPVASWDE